MVKKIIQDDAGKLKPDKNTQEQLEFAKAAGWDDVVAKLQSLHVSHPQKDHSFHYLPYRKDSGFEQTFLAGGGAYSVDA